MVVGSVAGLRNTPGNLYSVTKWAAHGLVENVRLLVAKDGVGVTLIAPGEWTPRSGTSAAAPRGGTGLTAEQVAEDDPLRHQSTGGRGHQPPHRAARRPGQLISFARRGSRGQGVLVPGNRAHLRKRRIKAIIPEEKDQAATRKKKGRGGRPVSHDAEPLTYGVTCLRLCPER